MSLKFVNSIDDLKELRPDERAELKKVTDKFLFQANDYYLSLIDWNDPHDPIRRVIIPDPEELEEWGRLDASDEEQYTVLPGLQHKYDSTVLLLVSNACGGICRYCFRKRIFMRQHLELLKDLPPALDYIRRHREITNVLVSGGDPLTLETAQLNHVLSELRKIDHVQIIRIGTKMLTYAPDRILNDPSLLEMVEEHSLVNKKIHFMTHFNHPREITDKAAEAIFLLQKAGAILANQTPLLRGVNDNPDTLAELFRQLSFVGVPPYYVFQCRPASGNRTYSVPIEEGYSIFEQARTKVSGLAKRARFVMSHASGKIETVGVANGSVFFKYHRAANPNDDARFIILKSTPEAYWFDDYDQMMDNAELMALAGG